MQCVKLKWPSSWSVEMMEKAGGDELGLGEEKRSWKLQARLVARSRFLSALTYKPVACKQAPGEDAKKI